MTLNSQKKNDHEMCQRKKLTRPKIKIGKNVLLVLDSYRVELSSLIDFFKIKTL